MRHSQREAGASNEAAMPLVDHAPGEVVHEGQGNVRSGEGVVMPGDESPSKRARTQENVSPLTMMLRANPALLGHRTCHRVRRHT